MSDICTQSIPLSHSGLLLKCSHTGEVFLTIQVEAVETHLKTGSIQPSDALFFLFLFFFLTASPMIDTFDFPFPLPTNASSMKEELSSFHCCIPQSSWIHACRSINICHTNEWLVDVLVKCHTSPILFPARYTLKQCFWGTHEANAESSQMSLPQLRKQVYPWELP